MMRRGMAVLRCRWVLVAGLTALVLASTLPTTGQAAESSRKTERPARGIAVYPEYSRLKIPLGENLRMDLTVENRGRQDENVILNLTRVPKGWSVSLKGGQFAVSGVPVASTKSRVLTFSAKPDKALRPGTYTFEIEGMTADKVLVVSQTIVVTTEEHPASAGGDLQISTSYPVLRGPTDSSFEFSLDVKNKSDSDRIVNVSADAPRRWDVNIKPAYEAKQITSLRVRAGASQTVALEVKAPPDVRAGEYPVLFHASAEKSQADARLKVILTGTYKLDAATPDSRLSLDAVVGRPSTMTLLVKNSGSATNHDIKLSAFAPENWKVEFTPKTITALEPGDVKQVEVKITPAARALVGDYSVALTADGGKATKTVEMRVTAHASTTWAWVGVSIIAAVIGVLGGLFTWLGRR